MKPTQHWIIYLILICVIIYLYYDNYLKDESMSEKFRAIDNSEVLIKTKNSDEFNLYKFKRNPIDNDTIFVYHAYLIKPTTEKRPEGQWMIRMTIFANCHDKEKYTFAPFILTNTNMKNYTGRIYSMDATCMSGFTPGCLWGPYFIDVEIPDEDVKTIGESAIFSYKDRKVKIPKIHRVPPRESGLAVCTTALFWYIDFPKLIEWIEIWRAQGASKFYIYYQMVSREVYEVLKAYEKMGIVELIPAENLPTSNETGFNPDSWIFRTGDRVYQNDCVMRAKTKFVASIDSDEIMIPQGNLTMLEFLENEVKQDPKVGGFQLNHQAMQYDPKKMPHLKAPRKDFDWKKLEYDWLKTASIHNKNWAMGKSINMPDHVNIISIHFIAQMQHPYKILDVPHAKAVYYHVRISWLASNENPTKENNSHLYEPKLRSFFNDDFVKTVHSNYQKIMEEVETNMGRKPIPYYEVFDILPKCLKDWRSYHQCSPLVMCYKDLSNFTEWVYANPSNYEAKYLLTL